MTTGPATAGGAGGERLLTPAEAAAELGVKVPALRYMEANGLLGWRAVRLPGGHRRYPQGRIRVLREEREARAGRLTASEAATLPRVSEMVAGRQAGP